MASGKGDYETLLTELFLKVRLQDFSFLMTVRKKDWRYHYENAACNDSDEQV